VSNKKAKINREVYSNPTSNRHHYVSSTTKEKGGKQHIAGINSSMVKANAKNNNKNNSLNN
jgi:hypothetical protein